MKIKNLLTVSLLTVSSLFATKPAQAQPIGTRTFTVKNRTNYRKPVTFMFHGGTKFYQLSSGQSQQFTVWTDTGLVWYQGGEKRYCHISFALGNKYRTIELYIHNGTMYCQGVDPIRRAAASKPAPKPLRVEVVNGVGSKMLILQGKNLREIKNEVEIKNAGMFYVQSGEDRFYAVFPDLDIPFGYRICDLDNLYTSKLVIKLQDDEARSIYCDWIYHE